MKRRLGASPRWTFVLVLGPCLATMAALPAAAHDPSKGLQACSTAPCASAEEADLEQRIRLTAHELYRLTRGGQVPWSEGTDAVRRHLGRVSYLRRMLRSQLARLPRRHHRAFNAP